MEESISLQTVDDIHCVEKDVKLRIKKTRRHQVGASQDDLDGQHG